MRNKLPTYEPTVEYDLGPFTIQIKDMLSHYQVSALVMGRAVVLDHQVPKGTDQEKIKIAVKDWAIRVLQKWLKKVRQS